MALPAILFSLATFGAQVVGHIMFGLMLVEKEVLEAIQQEHIDLMSRGTPAKEKLYYVRIAP